MAGSNATLVERRDVTAHVASLFVRPDDAAAVPYAPGQYATLGLADGDRIIQRPYSMAAPHAADGAWEFHVRRVRGGALTERLWEVPAGGRLRLGAPRGRFTADPADPRLRLFVATGTGIAPFVAMIRDDLAAGRRRETVVVHGVAHADELGFSDFLTSLDSDRRSRIRYLPTISRPTEPRNAAWSGATGRAETTLADRWDALALDPGGIVAYLCGNPGMVAAVQATLAARGVAPGNVRTESYWLDRAPAQAA
jgi:ferredoxin--NADP+ reductase